MVHHIPGFISHQISNKFCQRAAFILIDGLSIDQWLIIKGKSEKTGIEEFFGGKCPVRVDSHGNGNFKAGCVLRQGPALFRGNHRVGRIETRQGGDNSGSTGGLPPTQTEFVAIPGDIGDLATVGDLITTEDSGLGIDHLQDR